MAVTFCQNDSVAPGYVNRWQLSAAPSPFETGRVLTRSADAVAVAATGAALVASEASRASIDASIASTSARRDSAKYDADADVASAASAIGGSRASVSGRPPSDVRGRGSGVVTTSSAVTPVGLSCTAVSITCRGTWARVTIDEFRHLALQTFKKYRASSNICSNKMFKMTHPKQAGVGGEQDQLGIVSRTVRRTGRLWPGQGQP